MVVTGRYNQHSTCVLVILGNPTYQKGTERMGTRGQETHYTEISGNNAQYMALVGRKEERDSYQELMKPGRQSHSNVGDEPQYMYASTDSIADQLHLRHLVASSDSDLIPQPAEKKDCVQFYNVLESTVVTSPSKLPPQSPVYAAVSSAGPEYRAYETPETVLPSHERPGSLALKNRHKTESQSVGQNVGPPQSLKSEGYETPGVMISQVWLQIYFYFVSIWQVEVYRYAMQAPKCVNYVVTIKFVKEKCMTQKRKKRAVCKLWRLNLIVLS